MKLILDTESKVLVVDDADQTTTVNLYSQEAFDIISREWVRVGWNQKYQYTFTWMGRPIIQLPEDMIRIQEVIFKIKPDVIIETGVAHGGSLIFYSSLCKAMDKGRVIGIDIEIRSHNRATIESHPLNDRITLIEGSSTAPEIVNEVRSLIKKDETVLVILDSNHSYEHVMAELESYAGLVSSGSYIIATDGIMQDLADVPRGNESWRTDNPSHAACNFAAKNSCFIIEQPAWLFNESNLDKNITHWPNAWLKRL